eukprot:CAMPEP_0172559504 /NCGR_PEP_ID=MMETSP1067-20121228/84292_1 /TAXON_ID=265564 ORGANISM="Thalassiosira punctigera, Strain Tpunct2005C2" /NCGR_SAMPLE_ID=MMETSP1067 /ASSEMBLY_ACC=CAM_ASM_000444 /LENGTH=32 /DNA_ID= /DNA_START= /DNA_END= /DNA_ORIENTATION=
MSAGVRVSSEVGGVLKESAEFVLYVDLEFMSA